MLNSLTAFIMNDSNDVFSKVIMQCDITHCITCMSNKVQHLNKKQLQKFYQRSYMLNL